MSTAERKPLYEFLSRLLRTFVVRRRVGIILYHSISPERFDAHLQRLTRLYNVISYELLVRAIAEHDWSQIPTRSLVITFDDGLADFTALAPVIRKYRVPVTHFVVAGHIGTNRHLWFREAREYDWALQWVPNDERLQFLRDRLGYTPGREYPDRESLNGDEVRELAALGIRIGSHTVSHPILARCDDATAREEITRSKQRISEVLGAPVEHFAYPWGQRRHYDEREIELLREAGYRSARSTLPGWNGPGTPLYELRVLTAGDDLNADDMEWLEMACLQKKYLFASRWLRRAVRGAPDVRGVLAGAPAANHTAGEAQGGIGAGTGR